MTPLPPRLQGASQLKKFRRQLLRWYDRKRRDLPWRGEQNPYRIWVSEIMLQQTRVAVVAARYRRFLRRFPDIKRLARAPLSAVLAEWSGLGYYRRARYLHQAARELYNRRSHLPNSAAELRMLPGIGRYTAAAIASIAFNQPIAVVDGNVERVLRRLLASSKPDSWGVAQYLLEPRRPGDFNQALMELGATVCLPGRPQCHLCPLADFCERKLRSRGMKERPKRVARNRRQLAYQVFFRRGRVYLVERSAALSLMPGMWELPPRDLELAPQGADFSLRHSITNTDYQVIVSIGKGLALPKLIGGRWHTPAQLKNVPITGLTRKILKRAGILRNQ